MCKFYIVEVIPFKDNTVVSPEFDSKEKAVEWGNRNLQASWLEMNYCVVSSEDEKDEQEFETRFGALVPWGGGPYEPPVSDEVLLKPKHKDYGDN